MKLNLDSAIVITCVALIISFLYLVISVLGTIKIDKYQPDRGNETMLLISGIAVLVFFCLTLALFILKIFRKVKK